VESFTQCTTHQYTQRVEVLSLLHNCADMGARWQYHKASTLLSRVTRTIYSYKKKEITYYILIGSLCYMLTLKVYSFLTACTPGGVQSFWFWIESVVVISSCHLYLFPSYPSSLLTSCSFGCHPAFGTFWPGYSPFISLLALLQGHNS